MLGWNGSGLSASGWLEVITHTTIPCRSHTAVEAERLAAAEAARLAEESVRMGCVLDRYN